MLLFYFELTFYILNLRLLAISKKQVFNFYFTCSILIYLKTPNSSVFEIGSFG